MKQFIVFCISICCFLSARAQEAAPVPSFYKPLGGQAANDFAGILTVSQLQQLNQNLSAYQAATGNLVLVIIISSLKDSASGKIYGDKEAAKLFFNDWKADSRQKNNAALLLVAMEQKKIQIALGNAHGRKNLETGIRLIDMDIMPYFMKKAYFAGIEAGIQAIKERLFGTPHP